MPNYFNDAIVYANSYPPLLADDYIRLEEIISKEFKWYIIGLTCWLADKKEFYTELLNDVLTREQVAQNTGISVETMKRYMCYVNSVDRLHDILPELASNILAGKTRLGLKTAIILAKQSAEDISSIMKRISSEETSVRQIISEQVKRPLMYPRKFSDGRSTKYSPKSVKDRPRYDPDAQVTELTFTIPSWEKAINRLYMDENLHEVSKTAQLNLNIKLETLKCAIDQMREQITEAKQ
jgi:hypothetical protein